MTERDIDRIVSDRFGRWGRFLREQGATPIIVLGYRHRDGELVITTAEGIADETIRDALIAAAAALSAGRIDPS